MLETASKADVFLCSTTGHVIEVLRRQVSHEVFVSRSCLLRRLFWSSDRRQPYEIGKGGRSHWNLESMKLPLQCITWRGAAPNYTLYDGADRENITPHGNRLASALETNPPAVVTVEPTARKPIQRHVLPPWVDWPCLLRFKNVLALSTVTVRSHSRQFLPSQARNKARVELLVPSGSRWCRGDRCE